jgi:hypothetical protein
MITGRATPPDKLPGCATPPKGSAPAPSREAPPDTWLRELQARPWAPQASFASRLLALQRALQTHIDRQPDLFARPRVAVTIRLTLDDLAWLLPPAEQRLLAHLRARKPLRALDGTRGCHTVSRRNERLQRLLSRVHAYCGAPTRHRLMQPYDRPGHHHRQRPAVAGRGWEGSSRLDAVARSRAGSATPPSPRARTVRWRRSGHSESPIGPARRRALAPARPGRPPVHEWGNR